MANPISAPPTIIIYSLGSNSKQFSGQYNSCVALTHVSTVFIILTTQEFSEIKHDFLKIYFDDIVPTLVTGFFLSNLHCDQIGRFLEFLGNKFRYKSNPNVWWLLGQLWKPLIFQVKRVRLLFGKLLEKFGLLFISTSGHTSATIYDQCTYARARNNLQQLYAI